MVKLKSYQNSEDLSPDLTVTTTPVRCLYSVRHFWDSREVRCHEGEPRSPAGIHHHGINVSNMTDFISGIPAKTGHAFDHSRCGLMRKGK